MVSVSPVDRNMAELDEPVRGALFDVSSLIRPKTEAPESGDLLFDVSKLGFKDTRAAATEADEADTTDDPFCVRPRRTTRLFDVSTLLSTGVEPPSPSPAIDLVAQGILPPRPEHVAHPASPAPLVDLTSILGAPAPAPGSLAKVRPPAGGTLIDMERVLAT